MNDTTTHYAEVDLLRRYANWFDHHPAFFDAITGQMREEAHALIAHNTSRAIAADIAESEASTGAKNAAQQQTYTATVGITFYANSEEEADRILDDLFERADAVKYANIHDLERDEDAI